MDRWTGEHVEKRKGRKVEYKSRLEGGEVNSWKRLTGGKVNTWKCRQVAQSTTVPGEVGQ